jgi:signal transduction histidine kinase
VLRRRARAGSRAFELLVLSLAGLVPLLLTALAVALVPIGLLAVSASLVEIARAWAQQYRRTIGVPELVRPDDPEPADHRAAVRTRFARLLRDPATRRDLAWALTAPVTGAVLLGLPLGLGTYGVVALCAGVWEAVSGWAVPVPAPHLWWVAIVVGLALWALALVVVPLALRVQVRVARAFLGPTAAAQVRRLAEDRAELVDGRAAELRRIERDLHDGAQTRLVAIGLTLRTAERLLATDPEQARALLVEARGTAADALAELRTLVRGIHPPVLAERGLGDAVRALALTCPVPAQVSAELPRPVPDATAAAVYFAVSELLANVAKHARARLVRIELVQPPATLRIRVVDAGRGGADPAAGTGLRGIQRRLAAFDATIVLHSPPGGPTTAVLEMPCASS